MEIEYYSAEELRKVYFDVTGLDACDCDGEVHFQIQLVCKLLINNVGIEISSKDYKGI